ncbi:hypothetical protein VNO77_31474 [Canavalia gladiata]|uniref:Uncharacterized protein n=1 Tax=Canavalia gladiata TaxID=3824 RepID=A0AAN9Q1S5_CANGL
MNTLRDELNPALRWCERVNPNSSEALATTDQKQSRGNCRHCPSITRGEDWNWWSHRPSRRRERIAGNDRTIVVMLSMLTKVEEPPTGETNLWRGQGASEGSPQEYRMVTSHEDARCGRRRRRPAGVPKIPYNCKSAPQLSIMANQPLNFSKLQISPSTF